MAQWKDPDFLTPQPTHSVPSSNPPLPGTPVVVPTDLNTIGAAPGVPKSNVDTQQSDFSDLRK